MAASERHCQCPSRNPAYLFGGLAFVALLLAAIVPAAAGAADPPLKGGAPLAGEVRLQSLVGLPPEAYSMFCTTQPDCRTSGNIDLETKATVPIEFDPLTLTTHGVDSLPYSKAEGSVQMSWACGSLPGRFVWNMEVTGSRPGKLAVMDVQAVPGSNALSVTLDPGGEGDFDFPEETVDRSDGGCGAAVRHITQQMGTWYFNFHLAAREGGSIEKFGDVTFDGLTWKNGVYTRDIDRFLNVGYAPYRYPLYEHTRIEVEPEYCVGRQNRIASATSNGRSLGVDGMRFFPGQQFTAPPKTRIRLADGSEIELEKGGSFFIGACDTSMTRVFLRESVGKFWVHVKHAVSGPSKKFDVVTERAVAGSRGTIFEVSYNKGKQLTKVRVKQSKVSLKGRNGAKGKVLIKKGQVGVQQGRKAPRIVKR